MNIQTGVSGSFITFSTEASRHHKAWMTALQGLDTASALDKKTGELAYLAVMAAVRLESGIPFHVQHAKQLGASRDEIISAILVGLPAVGNAVISSLPAALQAYDSQQENII
jgi:alkylhydroperoxidase/carboxymuconolactone decarboxylase family protein YurZ